MALGLGPVADVGMAAVHEAIERYVKLLGYQPLPVDRLAAAFDRAVDWNHPVLGVFDTDWLTWAHAEPRAAGSRRFAELLTEVRDRGDDTAGTAWARMAHLPDRQRLDALTDLVATMLARVLGAGAARPDPDSSLTALGLDSLMVVELQTNLNRALGADLSLMGLLDSQTIRDVARGLDERLSP